jgi:hypothetical protein
LVEHSQPSATWVLLILNFLWVVFLIGSLLYGSGIIKKLNNLFQRLKQYCKKRKEKKKDFKFRTLSDVEGLNEAEDEEEAK